MERTENRIRALRASAAEAVLRRIRRDRDAAQPRFRELLATIGRRLFDPDFKVSDLWTETGIDPHRHVWFRSLDPPTSPSGYIAAGRLDTAAEMLRRDPDLLEVWKIAEAVCYAYPAFFAAFKKRFGMAPSEYRDRHGRAGVAVEHADVALASGFPAAALDRLADADATDPRVAARLGLALHGYASVELKGGRTDDAYAHLALARRHYAAAGELPGFVTRHRILTYVTCQTDEVLLDALCGPCRGHLLGKAGASLRRHLRDALALLPTGLDWFQVCCDDCYGVIWHAVDLARYGFLSDAWQAQWLAEHANLGDPHAHPSVGRVIAALARVEKDLHFQDQEERLATAERARAEAKELGNSLLEAQARMWCGNSLRALARFPEARRELKLLGDWKEPWLLALHHRFFGLLERETNNNAEALSRYGTAAALYQSLDPHFSGHVIYGAGVVHWQMKLYRKAITLYRQALGALDGRRDPLAVHGVLPIALAVATALAETADRAMEELARCRFDRDRHPVLAAHETFTRGCIAQTGRRHREALSFLSEAQRQFDRLHQPLDCALAANQSVESHYCLGEEQEAVNSCVAAARFFEEAACPLDTLDAISKLEALVKAHASTRTVTVSVRRLAQRHGGWLPEPSE